MPVSELDTDEGKIPARTSEQTESPKKKHLSLKSVLWWVQLKKHCLFGGHNAIVLEHAMLGLP